MELVQDPEEILARAPEGAEDIADELAAPPRRKLPWLTLVLAAGVIAAGGFIGGVEVQKSQGGGSATAPGVGAFRTGAGGFAAGGAGFARGGAGAGSGSGLAGGGGTDTVGTVKLVDGSTVYVSTADGNIVKVTTNGSTKVRIAKSAKVSDLQPGQQVTVAGTQDSSGSLTATTLTG
jgi:hypothetical protein